MYPKQVHDYIYFIFNFNLFSCNSFRYNNGSQIYTMRSTPGPLRRPCGKHFISKTRTCPRLIVFLSRVSTLTRVIDVAVLSVCLSVRDVPVLDENDLTYCHSFLPYGSLIILVLLASNIFTKFRRSHPPCRGAKCRWVQKFRYFLPISAAISRRRYKTAPYRRLLQNCTQAFEWHLE